MKILIELLCSKYSPIIGTNIINVLLNNVEEYINFEVFLSSIQYVLHFLDYVEEMVHIFNYVDSKKLGKVPRVSILSVIELLNKKDRNLAIPPFDEVKKEFYIKPFCDMEFFTLDDWILIAQRIIDPRVAKLN